MALPDAAPAVFLTATGTMEIRMAIPTIDNVRSAAKVLNAKYFVMQHDWAIVHNKPIWGVFAIALPDPIKTFEGDGKIPAVLYAAMKDHR